MTLLREDGSPTYQLASVVDDIDFGITHVVRGNDHRPNEALHRRLHEALGTEPPEYVHHGLILGDDGKKLSKRAEGATVASLREPGIPAEAVRAYLEELGIPRHDVHLDLARVRRLAMEAIEGLSDEELAARVGAEIALRAGDARRARPERGAGVRPAGRGARARRGDDLETLDALRGARRPAAARAAARAEGGRAATSRRSGSRSPGRDRTPSYGDPGGAAAGRGAAPG